MTNLTDPELESQKKRPPYIPHPEIRDTVPNVSLYSVLYKLPDYFYSTATTTSASMLDRQLSATADFFDRCVPNQPGFSSSVAAVTILPDSAQVAKAWRKWYACASKLRRLRFIRSRIRLLEHQSQHSSSQQPTQPQQPTQSGNDTIQSASIATATSHSNLQTLPTTRGEQENEPEISNINNTQFHPIDTTSNYNNFPSNGSPITTPRSLSPRHPQRSVLSTVEEFEDLSSEARDMSFLSRSSQNTQDVESIGKDTASTKEHENILHVATDEELPDFASCLDQGLEAQNSGTPGSQMAQASLSASESTSTSSSPSREKEETPITSPTVPLCRESNLLYSGSFESNTHASWIPSISTATSDDDASSSPLFGHSTSTTTGKPPFTPLLSNPQRYASIDYRRSPDTVGHAEEAKLDLFLSDEGMEQVRHVEGMVDMVPQYWIR